MMVSSSRSSSYDDVLQCAVLQCHNTGEDIEMQEFFASKTSKKISQCHVLLLREMQFGLEGQVTVKKWMLGEDFLG